MNKISFVMAVTCLLSACSMQSADESQTVSAPWNTYMDMDSEMAIEPDFKSQTAAKGQEAVEKIQINTPKTNSKIKGDSYMDVMATKLRQELLATGVQVKQSGNEVLLILPGKLVFGSNQTTIEPKFEPILAAAAKIIREYDKTRVQVIGYTDNVGAVATNHAFSLRRANAVSNFLRLNGIDINRLVVDGLGSEKPIASNKTAVGREQNRRVEITLINMQ